MVELGYANCSERSTICWMKELPTEIPYRLEIGNVMPSIISMFGMKIDCANPWFSPLMLFECFYTEQCSITRVLHRIAFSRSSIHRGNGERSGVKAHSYRLAAGLLICILHPTSVRQRERMGSSEAKVTRRYQLGNEAFCTMRIAPL